MVYFLTKLTVDHDETERFTSDISVFHYIVAFLLFFLTWEVSDWFIRTNKNSRLFTKLDTFGNTKVLLLTLCVLIPISALIYYIGIFYIEKIDIHKAWLHFRIDFFRAILLMASLSIFNQFYHISKGKKEIESSILKLKKEVMTSRYTSLKSQISPHFLFNSLNTLTSLMYEDRDLASDFVTRLASCYRYILDNREEDLVRLDKEIQFLDSFVFMLKVRHNDAITINTTIGKENHSKLIPTLSVQMLVENVLKHNYYSKEHPIHIDIFIEDDRIIVKNNIKKRTDSEKSTQLGLNNIKKRYAFYSLEKVIIENRNDTFSVSMPLLSAKLKQGLEESLTI